MIYDGQCDCSCHDENTVSVHIVPCCWECPECRRRVPMYDKTCPFCEDFKKWSEVGHND